MSDKRLFIVLQPPLDALLPSGDTELRTTAPNVLAALRQICADAPAARAQLLQADDQLSPFVHVFLNGRQVPAAALPQQPFDDGDELCLLTAIRGG